MKGAEDLSLTIFLPAASSPLPSLPIPSNLLCHRRSPVSITPGHLVPLVSALLCGTCVCAGVGGGRRALIRFCLCPVKKDINIFTEFHSR